MIKPEVLAPAGDMERLEAAVMYGADAVYLGAKTMGMRAAPQNFDQQGLSDAVEYCHRQEVKVYLTCNVLPTNAEVDNLEDFMLMAKTAGVDALIVADIGVLMLAKRAVPEIPVHISTQAGVVNYLTARELYEMGASRVVLARELSLEDIGVIRDKTPPQLEIECFVHGAICVSFSGRCLISQYLTGRDGNHGECSQPCRWGYHLMEEKRPGQFFPIFEDEKGTYILNAEDMCLLPYLDKLANTGVSSFKIEGRAKSAYYVAVATNAYRCAVDIYCENPQEYRLPEWLLDEPFKLSHRHYSTGFYFPEQPPGQYYQRRGYVRDWEVVAVVTGWEDGCMVCTERNRFSVGDTVEILEPGKKPVVMQVASIVGEDGEAVDVARHPMEILRIPAERPFKIGSVVRMRNPKL